MEKYDILSLFVIKMNEKKYVCESIISGEKYREVLTGKIFNLKDQDEVEKFSIYYRGHENVDCEAKDKIFVLKDEILDKYLEINSQKIEYEYYQEQTCLSFIIDSIIEKPDFFYKMVGEQLKPEEREYIKSLLEKNCYTCANGCCRIEQVDKPVYNCIGWENDRIVGEYKVLKLNRKNK